MVIDLGESEVLEREMAETLHRLVGRELSGAYFLENASESGGVHLVDIVEEVRG
jgi:hypothetical protein